MGLAKDRIIYRFDDRRCFNLGPQNGQIDRRTSYRREGDRFRAWLKTILTKCCEETISDEDVNRILTPVLIRIKAGEFG